MTSAGDRGSRIRRHTDRGQFRPEPLPRLRSCQQRDRVDHGADRGHAAQSEIGPYDACGAYPDPRPAEDRAATRLAGSHAGSAQLRATPRATNHGWSVMAPTNSTEQHGAGAAQRRTLLEVARAIDRARPRQRAPAGGHSVRVSPRPEGRSREFRHPAATSASCAAASAIWRRSSRWSWTWPRTPLPRPFAIRGFRAADALRNGRRSMSTCRS